MEREIYITENLTKDSASEIVRLFKMFEQQGNNPIKVYVNCYGGELGALFTVLDAMKTCTCEIITVNIGEADSAASLIFAAGAKGKRYCTENSRVMLHEVHVFTDINGEPLSRVEADLREWQIHQDRYIAELAGFSGRSIEQIKKDITGKDLYLSAQEAIEYGVADKIVTLDDRVRYQLQKKGGVKANDGKTPVTKENQMNKEEMLAALKKDHGVDVSALQQKADEAAHLKAELDAVKKENEKLTASKTDLEAKVADVQKQVETTAAELEASKKETAFNELVRAGKEFANQRETVLKTFKTAADMEAFYKDRPAVLKTQATGKGEGEAMDATTAKLIAEGKITKEDADKYLK
jgi:ATP-dependent Clp protease protease subunit